jgi:hypothetical protein
MLIRFEVSNFRSIREPVELSMVAIDTARDEAREIPNLGESLLHVAAILGPNASGKSNLIAAMTWLRDAVQNSLFFWDDGIPIEPFAFTGADTSSTFLVESVIDGVRFEYVVELDRRSVAYEGLFHYPEKKRRRIFEREGDELKLQRGLGNLSGIRELLTSRVLALSIARRFDEPLVSEFTNDLLLMQTLGLPSHARPALPAEQQLLSSGLFGPGPGSFYPTREAAGFDEDDRAQGLALLRLADLGIDDVVSDDPDEPVRRGQSRRLRLTHRTAAGSVPLDFTAESSGTQTWFELIGPLLRALKTGSVLCPSR